MDAKEYQTLKDVAERYGSVVLNTEALNNLHPVIFCKDCEYSKVVNPFYHCRKNNKLCYETDFCSFAKRREEKDEKGV